MWHDEYSSFNSLQEVMCDCLIRLDKVALNAEEMVKKVSKSIFCS